MIVMIRYTYEEVKVMFTVKNTLNLKEDQSCLVIGVFNKPLKFSGPIEKIDEQFNGQLTELVKAEAISAKRKSVTTVYSFGKIGAERLYIVGLGKEKDFTYDVLRETVGKAFKELKRDKLTNASIYLDSFLTEKMDSLAVAQLISETCALATYEFAGYKEKSNEPDKSLDHVTVYCESGSVEYISQSLEIGYTYGKAVNSARTLVNLPGNMLTATDLANYAKELAEKYQFEVEILEKNDMETLGMGAMLAVNNGSTEPPKMIVIKHQGKQEWKDVIGLVGKGITFDTGGYSIKPKSGIVGMKSDMGGAAAVLGAMEIIGALKMQENVVAVIPATDNMISGSALKPDDVITSMSGKTIEVLNTDAEGRLVLADAVTYAKHHGADYLIDVATLTGGVIVALGLETTGALTNNEVFFEQFLEASIETGERIWRLPLFEEDKKRVRNSKIADLNNSPGREGHAIMGGAFVGEFVNDTPWIHLDIAGTATTNKSYDLGESGATGVMTRTLALFVDRFEPIK